MKTFTGEQIEAAKSLLEKLEPVPAAAKKVSKQEAINALKKQIKGAQAKGYTISQIAEKLTTSGLEISESTLKSYIGRGEKKNSPAVSKKKAQTDSDNKKA